MEQEEALDFKSLRAKFQQEDAPKLRAKPAIPEKPKLIPPSPTGAPLSPPLTGARVSLLSSINSAVENKTVPRVVFKDEKKDVVPRVVFKDEKKDVVPHVVFKDERKESVKRLLSHPKGSKGKEKESGVIKPELMDMNQKKEGDLVKQALKERNLLLVLPGLPVKQETPPDPPTIPLDLPTPAAPPPPAKTTPKKKSIFTFKKMPKASKEKEKAKEKEKKETVESAALPVPAPTALVPPIPAAPSPAATSPAPTVIPPKVQRALLPPHLLPAPTPAPDVPAPTIPEPDVPVAIIPAPAIPSPSTPEPDISTLTIPDSTISEPDIPAAIIPDLSVPDPIIPPATIPDPDISDPTISEPDIPKTIIPDLSIPDPIIAPGPDISAPTIPEPDIPVPTMPDPSILDPIIPDRTIPDPTIPDPTIPAPTIPDATIPTVPALSTPAPSSPAVSRTISPTPVTPVPITPDPLAPAEPAASSPVPAVDAAPEVPEVVPDVEEPVPEAVLENGTAPPKGGDPPQEEPQGDLCLTPPRPLSALSALERAEEMSPGKRTPPCDQRVLNLLEKAKRKYSTKPSSPTSTTPEAMTPTSEPPSPVYPNPPDAACPVIPLLELPPIDYEDLIGEAPAEEPEEQPQLNGQALPVLERLAEQGAEGVQPALVASAPPPRKPLPEIPSMGPVPEKPPRPPTVDLSLYQVPTTPAEALQENEIVIPAPLDFATEDPTLAASEVDDPSSSEALDIEMFQVPEWAPQEIPDLEAPEPEAPEYGSPALSIHEEVPVEHMSLEPEVLEEGDYREVFGLQDAGTQEAEPTAAALPVSVADSPVNQEVQSPAGTLETPDESCDNVYEDLATNKNRKNAKKAKVKGPPKNPYSDSQPAVEETPKSGWRFRKSNSVESPDEKELKKKEKQRDKESQKLKEKEKERLKKEQKDREKKENEIMKKFKITGQEEAMYEARVMVASKGRKDDLAVNSGDLVCIIRTTNCPKGKWLAKDSTNKYGYISVKSVELDIKEMVELGKKASKAGTLTSSNSHVDGEVVSTGSRSSNHYALTTGSFTDDSEEWTCDDDELLSSPTETTEKGLSGTASIPEMASLEHEPLLYTLSDSSTDDTHMLARQEALQKLATFFKQPRQAEETVAENNNTIIEEVQAPEEEPAYLSQQEVEPEMPDLPDLPILPPPDLYADSMVDESEYTYSKANEED